MMQGTYTAATGITAQQRRLDTIANNLANVQTTGFKASRAEFKDALYSVMQRPVQPQDDLNLEKGHGVIVSGYMKSFTQGMSNLTQDNFDLMITGSGQRVGFFAVRTQSGEVLYTRDGQFRQSVEADGSYLVNSSGAYVLDTAGQRIRIQGSTLSVGPDGSLYNPDEEVEEGETQQPYARLQIVSFSNQEGLEAASGNYFRVTENSGPARQVDFNNTSIKVEQGVYEGSNVDLADQMALMVRCTRALQMASRALTTADQMDSTAINVRG